MPNWKPFSLLVALALSLGGCSRVDTSWMPLKRGASWSYSMRGSLMAGVYPMSVLEPTSLAGTQGWVMTGPLGRSRVAWVGERLVASEWAGTRFDPPLTLLVATSQKATRTWRGRVSNGLSSDETSIVLTQEPGELQVSGKKTSGTRVSMSMRTDRLYESTFFYVRGRGLVTSESRVDGRFVVGMEYLSGP